jgi:peptidylprolyl isomerase
MRKQIVALLVACAALVGAPAVSAQAPDPTVWRALDPENTLYIDTVHGRVVVELYPEIAPKHVEQIKTLAARRFFDGLKFHRVIENFMAQGGDPKGDGTGASDLPDVPGEFTFRRGMDMPFVEAAFQGGARLGFYKALPIVSQPDQMMTITKDGKASAWGLHCPGIASMARGEDPNSANSQFFLMRAAYPSLDKRYSIWGRVVWGQDSVMKLAVGEPPAKPDVMTQVRLAADLPASERAPIFVMRSESPAFRKVIEDTRKARGADFSVCDVQVPVRVPRTADDNKKERPWWRVIPLL